MEKKVAQFFENTVIKKIMSAIDMLRNKQNHQMRALGLPDVDRSSEIHTLWENRYMCIFFIQRVEMRFEKKYVGSA